MNSRQDYNFSSSIADINDKFTGGAVSDLQLALRDEPEVQNLARSIDEYNPMQILGFGKEPAAEVSRFSDQILGSFRTGGVEDSGKLLNQLSKIMDRFDVKDFKKTSGGIFGKLFKRPGKLSEKLLSKYQAMGKEMEQVYVEIKKYQSEIEETTNMLEGLYEQIYQYYMTLEKYIAAGQLKLNDLKTNGLPRLQQNAAAEDQMASMQLDALRDALELLEQRVYDLEMAKMVALQTAPQIRLLQRSNTKLIAKINSAFVTTIPIFKNGMIQAIAAKKQKLVADSMKELDRRTNEMLVRNAQIISRQSIEIAGLSGAPGIKIQAIEEALNIILNGMQETQSIEEENKRIREEGAKRLKNLQEKFKNMKQL